MLLPYLDADLIEAGCDEAGRGCLAGPVFAAAVILPKDFFEPQLNDSKQVNEKTRIYLRSVIQEKAIAWAVAFVDQEKIDEINILNASFLAMHKAIKKLKIKPELLLIDGNRFNPYKKLAHRCIVDGDATYSSIAAASILAKCYRDAYMKRAHRKFPVYGWKTNKGYATEEHRLAIEQHGSCDMHRKTFHLYDGQLKLEFEKEMAENLA